MGGLTVRDGLDWCRQRLLVPGQPLSASLLFVSNPQRDQLLVLRALIAELASVADRVTDAGVAQAKLAWWLEAVQSPDNAHPLVQAGRTVGLWQALPPDCWRRDLERLVQGVLQAMSPPRFNHLDELWAHCMSVAGPAASLEWALWRDKQEDATTEEALQTLAAAGYWIRLVRDVAGDARANRWLLPLALQAEYQINRQDVLASRGGLAWDGLIRAWLSASLKRAQAAVANLEGELAWRHRHSLIMFALDQRLAQALARRPQRLLRQRVLPGHWGNVWVAWRTARRLSPSARLTP